MQINKRSWHYRLYQLSANSCPQVDTNLCAYVQTILGGLFKWMIIGLCIMMVLFGAASVCYGLFQLSERVVKHLRWYSLLIPAGIALIVVVWAKANDISHSRTGELISEYLRAKKNRYCPTVKFTE